MKRVDLLDRSMAGYSATWRLLPFLAICGSIQMAIDGWLFDQCEADRHPPVLRFYTWKPSALSLGFSQKQWPAQWQKLSYHDQPIDLVRRPTGGRAVLHQGDLTYALVTSKPAGKRWEIYEIICEFLIKGWRNLGVELQYGSARRGYIHNPSCFNTATAADLVRADGSKLIGSAQRRGQRALLQHGSMILSTDRQLFEQIFDQVAPWQQPLCNPEHMDHWIPKIVSELVQSAQECFGVEFILQPLSDQEWQQILSYQSRYQINDHERSVSVDSIPGLI